MKSAYRFVAVVISFVLLGTVAAPPGIAQDQSTQNPPPAQTAPQQDQSQQGQEKADKDKKKKKGGGFFGGLKAVAGSSSEQQEATRTAGSKTVGEGAQIGDAQPTAADRQAVSAMENYSVPAPEIKKFQDDGKLKPKQ
jgi:hypothetical protein